MTPEQVFEGHKEGRSGVRPHTDMSSDGPDTQQVRDLGIDSISMMLVSLAVEEKFQMRFDTSAPAPTTVGEVIDAVLKAI